MARPATEKKETVTKREYRHGHYLYETGEVFWQCDNLRHEGSFGYILTDDERKKDTDKLKALYEEKDAARKAKKRAEEEQK